MMVKMKSEYRGVESKRLEMVVGAKSKRIFVCHVSHEEFELHLEGHRRTIEEF